MNAVVWSPDGTRLATSSRDVTAKLWDATTGQEVLTLASDDRLGLHSLAFSPDGKWLATGGDAGTRVYVLPLEDIMAVARSRVTRSLTTEECRKFLHRSECSPGS